MEFTLPALFMKNLLQVRMKDKIRPGFTLIELIFVVGAIAVLAALLFPAFYAVREAARKAYCSNNLRMLHLANTMHAEDHGHYVAAAPDIFSANLRRWHGVRTSTSQPFDGSNGPLAPYLGVSGEVRDCPSFRAFRTDAAANAFEASCGGYGYNVIGVGSRIYRQGMSAAAMRKGMPPETIRDPSRTVMFTDAAFPQPYGNNPTHLIEYSFAEAYHWVFVPGVESGFRADPSIHFRHRGRANVVWCDGHVSAEKMETEAENHFTEWDIGWFGPANNTLFNPY